MNIINTLLGVPFGYAIYFAYVITDNYALAILIFAVVARAAVFPVSILAQKNSIRLLQIYPALDRIKKRYRGDKERLNEAQYNLFKQERYSPFIGLIPLLIQLIIVMGVMQVMYHPWQHVLHITEEEMLASGVSLNFSFFGLDLDAIPSFAAPAAELMMPFVTAIAALALCVVQTFISPGALSQSKRMNAIMTAVTVAFSFYIALVTPAGVGLYWTAGNLLGIVSLLILNKMYPPGILAKDALAYIDAVKKSQSNKTQRQERKALKSRETEDAERFSRAKKRLVFYALTRGQYKYYKNIIDYILNNSDAEIHYLTNDPGDRVFAHSSDRLFSYYAGERKTISLMLKLDTDIMVTTVQGLGNYHMRRSVVRDDIEYIYIPHGLGSSHLTAREDATDNFDTIFCVGPNWIEELRRREEIAKLPRRNLVKAGYGVYDQIVEAYNAISDGNNDRPRIIIAPSWQEHNILELCINEILNAITGKGYEIILRPHPQFNKMFPEQITGLKERYSQNISDGEIKIETDISDSTSIYSSDILITDWSNIAFEFSYCTLKPCIFINTPMKVMNPSYEKYNITAIDITLREKIGVSVDVSEIIGLSEIVKTILSDKAAYKDEIERIVKQYLFHPGKNGEAGGKYIMHKLGV